MIRFFNNLLQARTGPGPGGAAADKLKEEVAAGVLAQARLRLRAGVPVIFTMLFALWYWGSPHGRAGMVACVVVLLLHSLYAASALYVARRRRPFTPQQMVSITAVLDPLLLSAFVGLMGENGSIFVCFYLFTTLGFGFRIGTRPMWICQTVSVLGFVIATVMTPHWYERPIPALTVLLLLVVVPMYATVLIRQLRNARALAEKESKAKSELLAKVSHELRTPLAGIVASAELIAADTTEQASAKRAATILSLSHDLTTEINDLLDTAKYKADALVLEMAPFDVRDVVEKIRLTLASAASSKGIGLACKVDDAITDRIVGDAHYLGRVLLNIVGNAVKFTNHGGVELSLKMLDDGGDQYRIRFAVQDTGIGIEKHLHTAIFDPFFQASAGTTRKYGGTGLGMSLARELVRKMGGDLLLESEVGKGSLFYFELKFARAARQPDQQPSHSVVRVVSGKRILVADDNVTNLLLVQQMLEVDGHYVTTATGGEQAVQLLATQRFDLVFLDFNMGDMDGGDVLRLYRFGRVDAAPVFFLTADVTLASLEKLLAMGATGVLHKPISLEGLRKAVVQVFAPEAKEVRVRSVASKPAAAVSGADYLDHAKIQELEAVFPWHSGMVELLESAISDTRRNCEAIVEAIEFGDVIRMREKAHALKGVTDGVGATRLSAVASRLMKTVGGELARDKASMREDLLDAAGKSMDELRQVIDRNTSATPK